MKYLLDSITCIERFRRGAASPITSRILATPKSDICLCSIVRGELLTGALKSANPTASVQQVIRFAAGFLSLGFDDYAADKYAEIRAGLEKVGTPIGPSDTMIAAIAQIHGLAVVSNNVGEFSRVPAGTHA